jgi:hypothetical protein
MRLVDATVFQHRVVGCFAGVLDWFLIGGVISQAARARARRTSGHDARRPVRPAWTTPRCL